ncbi:MAG TPA: hypothetical protein PKW66_28100, partial [Polyangiaceae bacterium]|nr:hypothetical protein [Polyangiaceae bacterium]
CYLSFSASATDCSHLLTVSCLIMRNRVLCKVTTRGRTQMERVVLVHPPEVLACPFIKPEKSSLQAPVATASRAASLVLITTAPWC